MYTLEIFYQSLAIAGAIGSLIGGVASVVVIWEKRYYKYQVESSAPEGGIMRQSYIVLKAFIGCCLILLSSYLFSMMAFGQPELKNQKLVIDAWTALNQSKYEVAINVAKECIVEFQIDALKEQSRLESINEPIPSVGTVSPGKKEEILKRGLLNDVAACWFIIGTSEMKKNNTDKAISAFNKLKQFSYARIYDPKWDGFWSPKEKAEGYIQSLKDELY